MNTMNLYKPLPKKKKVEDGKFIACGHPANLKNTSVTKDYVRCRVCENAKMKRKGAA